MKLCCWPLHTWSLRNDHSQRNKVVKGLPLLPGPAQSLPSPWMPVNTQTCLLTSPSSELQHFVQVLKGLSISFIIVRFVLFPSFVHCMWKVSIKAFHGPSWGGSTPEVTDSPLAVTLWGTKGGEGEQGRLRQWAHRPPGLGVRKIACYFIKSVTHLYIFSNTLLIRICWISSEIKKKKQLSVNCI